MGDNQYISDSGDLRNWAKLSYLYVPQQFKFQHLSRHGDTIIFVVLIILGSFKQYQFLYQGIRRIRLPETGLIYSSYLLLYGVKSADTSIKLEII